MRRQIIKSSLWVSLIAVFATGAELFKDIVVASKVGISSQGDAFFLAITLPLLFIGALFQSFQISFVPLFSKAAEKEGKDESIRLVNLLITVAIPLLFFLTATGITGSHTVISWVGAGLTQENKNLAAFLSQILFFAVFIAGFTGLLMNWLNSQQHFSAPASINIFRSMGMVLTIWLLWDRFGVDSFAYGFVVGSLLQLLVIILSAYYWGFRYHVARQFDSRELRYIFGLIAWPFMLILLRQINVLTERFFASFLDAGSISALSYAYRIVFGIVAIFSTSVFTVTLPTLSRNVGRQDIETMRSNLSTSVKFVFLVVVLIVAIIIPFSQSFTAMVYQRGVFDQQATQITSRILTFYMLSLILRSLIPLVQMPFYAFGDVKTPIILAFISAGIQILCGAILVKWFSVIGLVLADSIARTFEISTSYLFLRRKVGNPFSADIWLFASKVLSAGFLTSMLLLVLTNVFRQPLPGSFVNHVLILLVGGLIGLVIYAVLLYLFKVQEFYSMVRLSISRVRLSG